MRFVERILAVDQSLRAAELPHAFGGALALGFCVQNPRATHDIDVNVFVPTSRVDALLAALPPEVAATENQVEQLERDGQARLRWDETPVDVFLSNHPFHDHVESAIRRVSFEGVDDFPVLACGDLAVFKSFFARPKDAVDVATMVAYGAIDLDAVERRVEHLLGPEERAAFFARVREGDAPLI